MKGGVGFLCFLSFCIASVVASLPSRTVLPENFSNIILDRGKFLGI
jgi:hypothetical protein